MLDNEPKSNQHLSDLPYWIAFTSCRSIGPQKMQRLRRAFPDLHTAWLARLPDLLRAGFNEREAAQFLDERTAVDPTAVYEAVLRLDLEPIPVVDRRYPALLKEIYSPPALLYVRGRLPTELDTTLAVIGTRRTTSYGRQVTPLLVEPLVHSGLTIVSGLALGIDGLAHTAALDAGGITIAVLACGLDQVYPVAHHRLAERIIANGGVLVSEYAPGTPPLKQHFPARNRIISGLSRGVLVIEGAEDSGSLITARCAVEQNRDVFAVPGNITSTTAHAPNSLIKLGATVVTSPEDITNALNLDQVIKVAHNKRTLPASREESQILSLLSSEPVHIDELARKSKLTTSTINATLTMMEMKGLAKQEGALHYIRADRL